MRQVAFKTPTHSDFLAFDGAHCSVLWRSVSDGWICPCCSRSKFELLRWTMRFPKLPQRFQGWMAELHKHHDHSVDAYLLDDLMFAIPRFETTLICGQCNAADGHAKRVLGLPSSFSFSPAEISSFVAAKPHSKHEINYAKAQLVFDDIHEQENQNFLAQGYEFSTC